MISRKIKESDVKTQFMKDLTKFIKNYDLSGSETKND